MLATGAAASTAQDPGVAPAAIVLGGTGDLGDASSAAVRGAAAYFRDVNARGGVNGRSIVFRLVDDVGDALAATQRLVEQDAVFALFGSAGPEQSLAVRDYLNASRVPQLFVASGATTLGRDSRLFPWTIGFQPSRRAEGWIYGSYVARARPGAAVGVLFADDEEGRELLAGLRRGLARSSARVVGIQRVPAGDVAVESSVAALMEAGANVLALFVHSVREAARAAGRLGWRPYVVVAAGSDARGAPEGSVRIAYVKDPSDSAWRDDPGMRRYRSIMSRYARGSNAADPRHLEGMAAAYELVRVLEAAGKGPTRTSVMAAVRKLNDASNPFLLPGVVVRTGANDGFPIEQAQLRRFTQARWRPVGGLWRSPGG